MEKFPILYYTNENKDSINIQLFIIDICNYSCSYCCNIFPRSNLINDLDLVFIFINDLQLKTQKNINLTIVGGEPTLHPKLIEFCSKLITTVQNIHIEVLTNLSNTLDYYAKLLELGVKISASWHGALDKLNIEFVKKIYKIPKKYFDLNQVEIRIMFEHDNWNNSYRIFKLLFHKFKEYIEISLLIDQFGKLQKYTKKQIQQYFELVKLLPFTNNELTVRYNDNTETKLIYNGIFLNDAISAKGWKCNAGIDHIYIHANGNVYNCERYYEQKMKPICNIKQTGGKYNPELFKHCICCSDYCTCDLTIRKEKI